MDRGKLMSRLLAEALDVVDATDAYDSSTEARGRRAHARVLATIELAKATARLHREQRIANLLQLAQLDTKDAWVCPLSPIENRLPAAIHAGERNPSG